MTSKGPIEHVDRVIWLTSALEGVTLDTLPAFLEANPELDERELDIVRLLMMYQLAERFPTVFNDDSMKHYYEDVSTTAENQESMKRVFGKLGIPIRSQEQCDK